MIDDDSFIHSMQMKILLPVVRDRKAILVPHLCNFLNKEVRGFFAKNIKNKKHNAVQGPGVRSNEARPAYK